MCNSRPDGGLRVIVHTKDIHCLQVRIWARRTAIEAQQGNYALNVTGSILQFYEQYYNATYPLPKSGRSPVLLLLCSEEPAQINMSPSRPDRPA